MTENEKKIWDAVKALKRQIPASVNKRNAFKRFEAKLTSALDRFSDYDETAYGFNTQDVIEYAANEMELDYEITEDEAIQILQYMNRKADVSIGISWDTIEYFIERYFEDNEHTGNAIDLTIEND